MIIKENTTHSEHSGCSNRVNFPYQVALHDSSLRNNAAEMSLWKLIDILRRKKLPFQNKKLHRNKERLNKKI